MDLHDLGQHQPHQLEAALPAGAHRPGVGGLLPQVPVPGSKIRNIIYIDSLSVAPGELEEPLHVSECLHQGDDGEVVCPGGGDQGRDVPEAPGRVRGHIGQWSPVREGVLVLQQQVRGPGPGQSEVSGRSRD